MSSDSPKSKVTPSNEVATVIQASRADITTDIENIISDYGILGYRLNAIEFVPIDLDQNEPPPELPDDEIEVAPGPPICSLWGWKWVDDPNSIFGGTFELICLD